MVKKFVLELVLAGIQMVLLAALLQSTGQNAGENTGSGGGGGLWANNGVSRPSGAGSSLSFSLLIN